MTVRALGLVLALLAAPALAQPPAIDPGGQSGAIEEHEPPAPFPISGAGWCRITDSESDPPADPEAEPAEDDSIGCDFGIAASLFRPFPKRLPRLSVVGALGTKTLGAGLGWLIHRTDAGTAYGVALGAVAPWGPEGIDVSEWGLALGATLSITRAGRD